MTNAQDQFTLFGAYNQDMSIQKKKKVVYPDFKLDWDPAICLPIRLILKAKAMRPRPGERWQHWETRALRRSRKSLREEPQSHTVGPRRVRGAQRVRTHSLQPRRALCSTPRPWLRPSCPERIQYIYSVKRGSFFFLNEWKNTPLKNSMNGELPL